MSSQAFRVLGIGGLLCLFVLPLAAAPNSGKISGVVVDTTGTPQMGATVLISSEQLLSVSPVELLTNASGRFSTVPLPAGPYAIRVTLAGFLPAMEQHIQVNDQRTTLLEIALGSVFSSFEKLRRQPDQQLALDDWTWVLRASPSTRTVLRWDDGGIILGGIQDQAGVAQKQETRVRLDLTSGADHPGSMGNFTDSPATAFVYDLGIGSQSHLLMAGHFSYEGASSSTGLSAEWLPSGESVAGPVTRLAVRESQFGPGGPVFRALRMSHDDQFTLGDRVSLRYGAELLSTNFGGTTTALRPHGEVAVQFARGWQASATVAECPWEDPLGVQSALESAIDALDTFPTLMMRKGRPLLENGIHEEIAVEHSFNKKAELTAAVFHDRSTHTAVIGRGVTSSPEFLQDYFSDAFAYDGGKVDSTGARVAYRQKITDGLDTTVVYAYGGVLTPFEDSPSHVLRDQLNTAYRQSVATRVSATVPRVGTKFTAGYKWIDGPAVSRLDSYGESVYHLDPYLSMEVRQPLPTVFQCHMEVLAEVGNLLAQGYTPLATRDGQVVLVPSYRYIRGGFSLQF